MHKVLSLLVVAIVLSVFVSCEKKRGDAEACIDIGTSKLKSNNPVHFMNCSKYYDYTKWVVADADMVPFYTAPTDTLKHFEYTFAPGKYNVILTVYQIDSVSISTVTKEIEVTLP